MSQSGNLNASPLPQLLYGAYKERLTGLLLLSAAGGRSEIWLRDGYPVGASTRGAVDHLGRVLVEASFLDEAALQEAAAGAVADGVAFGRSLVEQRLIRDDELLQALTMQLRRRLHRLFFIDRGDYTIESRDHAVGAETPSLRIQPRRAIYNGIRHAWTRERLRAAAAPLESFALRLRADPNTIGKYSLSDEDHAIAELIARRPLTIAEAASSAGKPLEVALAVALAFHFTEALDLLPVRARTQTLPDLGAIKQALSMRAAAADRNDLYGVLDLPETATKEQVKSAYVSTAKLIHPDRFNLPGMEELRTEAERVFRHVSEAHATLLDDNSRTQWQLKRLQPVAAPGARSEEEKARAAVEAELAYQEGVIKLKRRDYSGAAVCFARAVELNPDEGDHIASHAWARVAGGQAQLAAVKDDLKRAVAKSPKSARAHYYLGVVYKEEGDLDRAVTSLRQAVQHDPRLSEAESELRLVTARRDRSRMNSGKISILDRLRGKKE